jgi:hypothetical protein
MIKNGHVAQQVFRAIGTINNKVCNKCVMDTITAITSMNNGFKQFSNFKKKPFSRNHVHMKKDFNIFRGK